MTDFDYDCYLKKSIAHSASRRKCGSKSKKCNLSTDSMTVKQWNERCGNVMLYQLGKPMVWAEFCKLPNDLKEEYMNGLIEQYSVNARNMAEMFGVSVATVFRLVKSDGLNVKFLKGRHPSGTREEAFNRFLAGEVEGAKIESDIIGEPGEEPTRNSAEQGYSANCTVESQEQTRLDGFTLEFSGAIDVNMIANSMRYILGENTRARITICCTLL